MLEEKCKEIRRFVWDKAYQMGSGHLGGTFSCVEILAALYYGGIIDPHTDKILIGKGHAFLAIYYILADLGIIDKSLLDNLGKDGSKLGGQLDISTPGVNYSTGSLGHVIGVAAGMAIANDLNSTSKQIVALVGDGECEEGSIWESLTFAARHGLSGITVIVDRNRMSVISDVDDYGFYNAVRSIGWDVVEVDGHRTSEIVLALLGAKSRHGLTMIVANTTKGKGISFIENSPIWHNRALTQELYEEGKVELGYS